MIIVEHHGGKDTFIPEHKNRKYMGEVIGGHLYIKYRDGVEQFPKTLMIYAPGIWFAVEYKR